MKSCFFDEPARCPIRYLSRAFRWGPVLSLILGRGSTCSIWTDGVERKLATFTSSFSARVFEVTIHSARRGRSQETLFQDQVTFEGSHSIAVSDVVALGDRQGILSVSITCLKGHGCLTDAVWATDRPPARKLDAMVVIPTFHREEQVWNLVSKLLRFRDQNDHSFQFCIVDNGGGVKDLAQEGVFVETSENFGGSGGFARGLIAAQRAQASHCVFMDDDAELHTESLARTLTYLAYATDQETAVCGAMIASENRNLIWENGASFFQFCQPHHGGTDITSWDQSMEMETCLNGGSPPDIYGGWWFFAFPTAAVNHLPYPFFLRGDDVSFCLANHFTITRLNGVAAYQEGFTAKESPRSWYLDLRSHLVHHLSQPDLRISALAMLKIVVFFVGQTVVRMHYGSARAALMAFRDVMRGPALFAMHTNMEARLNKVDKAGVSEAWSPLESQCIPSKRRSRYGALWLALGNGLFLTGFRWWGRKVTIRAQDRRDLPLIWGASDVTVLHNKHPFAYRVRHNKAAAILITFGFIALALRFLVIYPVLRRKYQSSYAGLTSRAFWDSKFAQTEATS